MILNSVIEIPISIVKTLVSNANTAEEAILRTALPRLIAINIDTLG